MKYFKSLILIIIVSFMFVKGYDAAEPYITCYYDDFKLTNTTTNPYTFSQKDYIVEVFKKELKFINKNDENDFFTYKKTASWIKDNFKKDKEWNCPYLLATYSSEIPGENVGYKEINIIASYNQTGNLTDQLGTIYQNVPNDKKESIKQPTTNDNNNSNTSNNGNGSSTTTNDNKTENNSSNGTNDTVIHDCREGSYYRYYYKNGSYKGMKFPGDLSFNFVKYSNGSLIFQVNYDGTVYNSNRLTSATHLISPALQVDSFTFDLGSLNYLNECPDPSDLYFCYSKSSNNYMITLDKTQCSESDSAVKMVSKETADDSNSSGTKDRKTSEGGWCRELIGLWTLLGYIKNIAYIFVPVLLIIMGSVTLLKAIISQKEDALKTAQKQLTNKIIAAVAVFLVVTVVNIAVGIVGDEGWKDCAACFIKPTSSECKISKSS